jgi:hypothetical protein
MATAVAPGDYSQEFIKLIDSVSPKSKDCSPYEQEADNEEETFRSSRIIESS